MPSQITVVFMKCKPVLPAIDRCLRSIAFARNAASGLMGKRVQPRPLDPTPKRQNS